MSVLLYDILYITACIYECSYTTVVVTLCIEMISVCIFTCRNFCYLLLKVLKLLYGSLWKAMGMEYVDRKLCLYVLFLYHF